MPRRLWFRIGLVSVVIAISLFYLYPPKKRINLGLDLQGGIHLVLGVEADKFVASQTERAAEDFKNAWSARAWASGRSRPKDSAGSPWSWPTPPTSTTR